MLTKLIYAGVVFMGFLAIMNPISGISIFLALTGGEDEEKIKKIALTATTTAFAIVFVFSLTGHFLLDIFGVSFTALKLAGGVLVALIGYDMLKGKSPQFNEDNQKNIQKTGADEGSIAVTPLGIPLLAGPGVIVTAMNFATGGYANLFITIFSFGLLCFLTYYIFICGKKIEEFLGANILKVFTKMMGLILIVIGTQMLIEGFYGAVQEFPFVRYF